MRSVGCAAEWPLQQPIESDARNPLVKFMERRHGSATRRRKFENNVIGVAPAASESL